MKYKITYSGAGELTDRLEELGLVIRPAEDASALNAPLTVGKTRLKNSTAVLPMEHADAEASGAPSQRTIERYRRFGMGGAGLVWVEATAISPDSRANPHQLMLCRETLDGFRRLADSIHAGGAAALLQLTHSGRFSQRPAVIHRFPELDKLYGTGSLPLATDGELEEITESFIMAAELAAEAGFDGTDIKACHYYLLSEALSAYERPGKYGGSYENRTRLIRDIFAGTSSTGSFSATRICFYDHLPRPYGFGAASDGGFDPSEALRLMNDLKKQGLALVGSSVGTDYLESTINRPGNTASPCPDEDPLCSLARIAETTRRVFACNRDTVFCTGATGFLGNLSPLMAAGLIEQGCMNLAGFGRQVLRDPDFIEKILNGEVQQHSCRACDGCIRRLVAAKPVECVCTSKRS